MAPSLGGEQRRLEPEQFEHLHGVVSVGDTIHTVANRRPALITAISLGGFTVKPS